MNDVNFLDLAIKEAKKSTESIGCGAVIVQNEKIIAKAYNTQRSSNNASAHAEINAIKKAGKKLGNKNLSGATIYCSCEPCTMCLSAIIFAKIKKLVYKIPLKKAFPGNIPVDIDINYFLSKTDGKLEVNKI